MSAKKRPQRRIENIVPRTAYERVLKDVALGRPRPANFDARGK